MAGPTRTPRRRTSQLPRPVPARPSATPRPPEPRRALPTSLQRASPRWLSRPRTASRPGTARQPGTGPGRASRRRPARPSRSAGGAGAGPPPASRARPTWPPSHPGRRRRRHRRPPGADNLKTQRTGRIQGWVARVPVQGWGPPRRVLGPQPGSNAMGPHKQRESSSVYAIVRCGGRQEKAAVDDVLTVDTLAGEVGSSVTLPAVLVVDDGKVISDPDELGRYQVTAEIMGAVAGP